jgi:hypothetical protein
VLREAIVATVEALAAGKIKPEEMPIDLKTNTQHFRYASSPLEESIPAHPYTLNSLARFLGQIKPKTDEATDGFRTMFTALELVTEGWLPESVFTDGPLPSQPWRIGVSCQGQA